MHSRLFIFLCFIVFSSLVVARSVMERPDTTRVYTIGEVTITEQYRSAELRSSAPFQLLSSKQLMQLNALQVADAVKFFSGVTVKDYGGIGGLKTVSVRSLGAAHTAVSYDGILVNDNQTGQMDIGRFSLDNVEALSLHTGQSDQIFQPARQFGSAATLNIRSRNPLENESEGILSFKTGSFGLLNPSFFYSRKLKPNLAGSVSVEWLKAHGRYPYKLFYHPSGAGDYTTETRINSDVQNLRAEAALHARFSTRETGWLKLYYYQAERGLPGATILYATENFSTQRLTDRTFFARANYSGNFGPLWSLQWNGNYHRGYLHYADTAYLNADGRQESRYTQQEAYSSLALLYRALPGLSLSFSSDGIVGNMDAVFENELLTRDFARPTRFSFLNVLAGKYVNEHLLATASVLSTAVVEQVRVGTAAAPRHRLSPFASISWKPFELHDIRLRAFYKNIFRIPTFNDLYYARVGNAGLRPEITDQWNAGITWTMSGNRHATNSQSSELNLTRNADKQNNIASNRSKPTHKLKSSSPAWLPLLSITADIFHNRVHDKIIALPTKNIFVWSMVNLGEVSITGADISLESSFVLGEGYALVAGGTYSYQRALDITDPESGTYLHQIAYTPRISGSMRAALTTPWAELAYSAVWSGKRYATGENYADNRLPGYSDHGLSASKAFKLLNVRFEVNNLLNEQYAIVRWYPMPGRNYRIAVNYKF